MSSDWLTELQELADDLEAEFGEPKPSLTLVELREYLGWLETEWVPTVGGVTPIGVRPTLTLIRGGQSAIGDWDDVA